MKEVLLADLQAEAAPLREGERRVSINIRRIVRGDYVWKGHTHEEEEVNNLQHDASGMI